MAMDQRQTHYRKKDAVTGLENQASQSYQIRALLQQQRDLEIAAPLDSVDSVPSSCSLSQVPHGLKAFKSKKKIRMKQHEEGL